MHEDSAFVTGLMCFYKGIMLRFQTTLNFVGIDVLVPRVGMLPLESSQKLML